MSALGITPEVWYPVVTLIIGLLLKGIFDALSDRRASQRERDARREHRLENIHLRRTELQREALLELQNYTMKLARSAGQVHHHDFVSHRTTGAWTKQLPENVDMGMLEAQVGTRTRLVRVRDVEVRRPADELSTACGVIAVAKTAEASKDAFGKAVAINEELQEQIGLALRNLDDEVDRIVDAGKTP